MSKKVFSEEEVALLRANPPVESVTKRTISFTPAFKQKVYDEMMNGAGIRDILLRHGIDPNVLGEMRIKGICEKIQKQAERPEGFQNLKRTGQKPVTSREKSLEKQIRELLYIPPREHHLHGVLAPRSRGFSATLYGAEHHPL